MVIEKLGDDRLIMSLDEPMQDADELNRLGMAATHPLTVTLTVTVLPFTVCTVTATQAFLV